MNSHQLYPMIDSLGLSTSSREVSKHFSFQFKHSPRGFYPIEMLVLIEVIGNISSIAVPSFGTILEKARIGARAIGGGGLHPQRWLLQQRL